MAMATISTEAAIFGRVIEADEGDLAPELARYILSWDFRHYDKERMHELAVRNQAGELAGIEREELDKYVKVGHLLAQLQSKARKSLRQSEASG